MAPKDQNQLVNVIGEVRAQNEKAQAMLDVQIQTGYDSVIELQQLTYQRRTRDAWLG
jgi:hypothetical protein